MPNKSKPFKKEFVITFKGRSRGFDNEPTFQETSIPGMLKIMVDSIHRYYPATKVTIEEKKPVSIPLLGKISG